MRSMAQVHASLGDRESAIDCMVRASSLDNPVIAAETDKFVSESQDLFKAFKKNWDGMHKGGG